MEIPYYSTNESQNQEQTKLMIPARTIQIVRLPIQNGNLNEGVCPELKIGSNIKIPNSIVKVKDNEIITFIANLSENDETMGRMNKIEHMLKTS